LNAVRAVGLEGVSLMVSWSCSRGPIGPLVCG
jgi:hypothetical protein